MPGPRPVPSHPAVAPRPAIKSAATWLHVAAASLIAEHKAGKPVDAGKLELARRVMASLNAGSPARAFSRGGRP